MNASSRYYSAHLFPCSGSIFPVYSLVSFHNPFTSIYIQAETTKAHRICSYTQSCKNSCITHTAYYSSEYLHLDPLKTRQMVILFSQKILESKAKKGVEDITRLSCIILIFWVEKHQDFSPRPLKKDLELQLHCDLMGAKALKLAAHPLSLLVQATLTPLNSHKQNILLPNHSYL